MVRLGARLGYSPPEGAVNGIEQDEQPQGRRHDRRKEEHSPFAGGILRTIKERVALADHVRGLLPMLEQQWTADDSRQTCHPQNPNRFTHTKTVPGQTSQRGRIWG